MVEADKRTSKEIAAISNFSPAALSMWINGKRVPGADELAELAKVFGVKLEDFFEGENLPHRLAEESIPFRAKPEIKTDDLSKLRRQVTILKGAVQQIELTLGRLENER